MINWVLLAEILYIVIILSICLRIIYDTRSTTKALAYLLLTLFLPFIGIIIYFAVGINYRKRKLYSKKIIQDNHLLKRVQQRITLAFEKELESGKPEVIQYKKLAQLILKDGWSPLNGGNSVKLLINGEQKFKEVLQALREAKHHIHIEYYIFEDDVIGNQIKNILIEKARAGVEVRFIYDDFGSRSIRKKLVPELKDAGVEAFPFYRIIFLAVANRLNYRNHRKIIIIDGCTAFTGGINVSDRYINSPENHNQVYWRDTHLRIDGPGIYYLQYLFIGDWNFCSDQNLEPKREYFCFDPHTDKDTAVQIVASGPDSETPSVLLSMLQAINLAQHEICITTPYFISGESLVNAMVVAALSGIKVKILVPAKSDSAFVDSAARSYYAELLNAGVEIYLYQKGFVHAKTIVIDGMLAMVGTANMDYRSFELNFEVNTIIYDCELAQQLQNEFYTDLSHAAKVDAAVWENRPIYKELPEKLARLLSPLL